MYCKNNCGGGKNHGLQLTPQVFRLDKEAIHLNTIPTAIHWPISQTCQMDVHVSFRDSLDELPNITNIAQVSLTKKN